MKLLLSDKEYKRQFPKRPRKLMDKLMENEEWTWEGLAEYFVRKVRGGDVDELIYFLQGEIDQ